MKYDDWSVPEEAPEIVDVSYKSLPMNEHAEKTILGAVLLDNNALLEASEVLCSDDFAYDSHRRIFHAMVGLVDGQKSVDLVTLVNELSRRKEIDAIGGVAYLASLTEGLPRRPVIAEYIDIVKDRAMLRELMRVSGAMADRAQDQSEPALDIASWAGEKIGSIVEGAGSVDRVSTDVSEATMAALNEFESRRQAESDETLSYGMTPEMDELTGGMFAGEVTVVGGESGVGKSSALAQALIRTGRNGYPSVCYSLEMTKSQLLGKMWSIVAEVPYRFVRFPRTATEEQVRRIRSAALEIAEWPLDIYDRGGMSLNEILATARLHIKRKGVRFVGVDYLQRITVPGNKDERLKVAECSKRLADLIKGTGAHLMLLSQLRRRDDNSFPTMRDLRESGQIENDAHCIALLWREYDKEKGYHSTSGMIVVPKQRFGFTGNVKTKFNTDFATFERG